MERRSLVGTSRSFRDAQAVLGNAASSAVATVISVMASKFVCPSDAPPLATASRRRSPDRLGYRGRVRCRRHVGDDPSAMLGLGKESSAKANRGALSALRIDSRGLQPPAGPGGCYTPCEHGAGREPPRLPSPRSQALMPPAGTRDRSGQAMPPETPPGIKYSRRSAEPGRWPSGREQQPLPRRSANCRSRSWSPAWSWHRTRRSPVRIFSKRNCE